jgi:ribosome-associated protein
VRSKNDPEGRRKSNQEGLAEARKIAMVLVEKKIRDVWVVDVAGHCSYADYLVLGDAENERHMQAALEALDMALNRPGFGFVPERGGRWTLLDLGDVVVDLFLPSVRGIYRLEDLYSEAPVLVFDDAGRERLVRPEERLSLYPFPRELHESALSGH